MKTKNKLQAEIRWFYLLSFLFSSWFATGNWYFLWRMYLQNQQIGIIDSICFAAGMFLEIPSGAMADILGRRKTLLVASLFMAIGYSMMGLATSGTMIFVSYFIFTLGFSLYSGADDALMYDNLISHKQEKKWKKVITTKNIVIRIAALLATAVGGYLFALNIRLPALVRGLFFFAMIVPILKLPENYGRNDFEKSFREYGNHIKDGIKQLFQPEIKPLLPLFVVVGSVTGTIYVSGLLRPLLLAKAGFDGVQQPYILGAAGLITVAFLFYLGKNWQRISDISLSWFLSFLVAACFIWLSFTDSHYWLIPLVLLQIIQGIFEPLTSEFVNRHISSSHRATALSSLSLLRSIPYVFAAPLIGQAADSGQFTIITLSLMGIVFAALLLSAVPFIKARDTH